MSAFAPEALARTLAEHARRYPLMEAADAVKLCHQAAFGAAHFCAGEAEALAALIAESAPVTPDAAAPLCEALGGPAAACRVSLAAAKAQGLSAGTLVRLFALSASAPQPEGAKEWFAAALDALPALAQSVPLPFTAQQAVEAVARWRAAGCGVPRHSQRYRQAYAPHYRVLSGPAARLAPLAAAVDTRAARLSPGRRLSVAMDGFAAAGKTTAAGLLGAVFSADVVHMDHFFLPKELRTPQRLAQPGGNVHYERFAAQVAPHLARREAFCYDIFDCARMETAGAARIGDGPVLFVEGAYAMHPACGGEYGVTAFFDAGEATQRARILARNGEDCWPRFRDKWIPFERAYERAFGVMRRAQMVVR